MMQYPIGAYPSHREGRPNLPHGDQPVGSSVSSHSRLTMVISQGCAQPKGAKVAPLRVICKTTLQPGSPGSVDQGRKPAQFNVEARTVTSQ